MIKNLMINDKILDKKYKTDRNQNTKKKAILSLLLVTTLALTTACRKQSSFFEKTMLQDTIVASVNGYDVFLRKNKHENYSNNNCDNDYIDVFSGVEYHDATSTEKECYFHNVKVDIDNIRPITAYLTYDELVKDEFTKEDFVQVQKRLNKSNSK